MSNYENTVIVAITNQDWVNNTNILPPAFGSRDGRTIVVHTSPHIELNGPKMNFDLLIDFTLEGLSSKFKMLKDIKEFKDKYIQIERESKLTQLVKINNAIDSMETQNLGLFHKVNPYKSIGNELESVPIGEYYPAPEKGFVVVKIDNGARGLGQAIVPTIHLNSFLIECKCHETLSSLKEHFPNVLFGNTDDDYNYFNHYDLVVTDFVSDITNEYRLFVAGSSVYGYERTRNYSNDFIQANIDKNSPIDYTFEVKPLKDLFSEDDSQRMKEFVCSTGIRFGSIDIFKTKYGKYGAFEYSPQFGMHEISPMDMRGLHEDFIDSLVRKMV